MTLRELIQLVELEQEFAFKKYLLAQNMRQQKKRADAIKKAEDAFLEKKAVCDTIANHIGQDEYLKIIED